MIAIASFFNQCYRECSKAFVKLERLPECSPKEREQYEALALALFSRHAPFDKQIPTYKCPKRDCNNSVSEL